MILVEQHIISKSNSDWKSLDKLCFLSKNLYNATLYKIKQEYSKTGKFLRYSDLEKLFRNENNIDYFNLPTNSSQQILRLFDKNLKSYFTLLKKWKKSKTSLNGCPKFPKYKDKVKGRNILIFAGQTQIRFKDGYILFPNKLNLTPLKTKIAINPSSKINEVRIVPKSNCYAIEIVYEKQENKIELNSNKAAIDLGLNNLITLTTNINTKPLIINGKPLKSINQYYNKKKGKLQSQLKKNHNKNWSKKLGQLTLKRDNKIKDYLHKSSRIVINYLKENNITNLVVGYNKEWKQNINIGKKNNQNFVNIPYDKLLNMINYKCKLEGVIYNEREESYTSKCSALDLEEINKHDNYLGKRIKRGLFKTKEGLLLNADVNGSLNIGRKEFGDNYLLDNSVNIGLVFNPIKVKLL